LYRPAARPTERLAVILAEVALDVVTGGRIDAGDTRCRALLR
jgi:hypothetical protein